MIDVGVVAALEHRGNRRELATGEVLVRQGELSEMVFVVLLGELAITIGEDSHEVEVGRCHAGDLIGEVACLAGVPRSATITAVGAAEVLAVEPQQFTEWLGSEPDLAACVLERARSRLHGVQVAEIAVALLGDEARPLVPQMLDMARWVDLGAGEALFAQGDEPDAAYFVLSGRLRVTAVDAAGDTRVIGEVGCAEVVGEAAVIQRIPRPATVTAVRDCTLARFDIGDFERLLVQHPALLLLVVHRLVARLAGSRTEQGAARSVALVVTAPVEPAAVVEGIMDELRRHGRSVSLTSAAIDELVGRNGIAQAASATLDDSRLGQFLYELESVHEHLVLVTDAAPTAWSRRALQRADCVIVVASPHPDAAELAAIAVQLELCVDTRAPRWLALVHPADAIHPAVGGRFLLRDQFDEVHHFRVGHRGDLARIARLSVGRGVGLVLGGGGARGFAHLGVLRALEELDVPVDRVGGASMGAIFAAAVALDLPSDELLGMCRTQFSRLFDYTVPVVALLKAKRITANLGEVFGGLDADDLWIPFYCVSTNLTRSRLEVHRSGDLVTVIRASIAIPGVLPPVPFGEDLLVDGGLLDNVPADVMRADPSISTVIAVDVAPPVGPGTSEDYGTYLSGWQALRRFARRRRPYPGVASVLVRSMITGSEGRRAAMQHDGTVDLYLAIEIPGVSMLEFDKIQPAFDVGYAASRPQIEQWVRNRVSTSVTPSSS